MAAVSARSCGRIAYGGASDSGALRQKVFPEIAGVCGGRRSRSDLPRLSNAGVGARSGRNMNEKVP